MTSREGHFEGVGFAGQGLEDTQGILSSALDKARESLELVINACGDSPSTDAGRNALALTVQLCEQIIPDAMACCEQIKAELIRYSGGF